jgi:hypothetical protein
VGAGRRGKREEKKKVSLCPTPAAVSPRKGRRSRVDDSSANNNFSSAIDSHRARRDRRAGGRVEVANCARARPAFPAALGEGRADLSPRGPLASIHRSGRNDFPRQGNIRERSFARRVFTASTGKAARNARYVPRSGEFPFHPLPPPSAAAAAAAAAAARFSGPWNGRLGEEWRKKEKRREVLSNNSPRALAGPSAKRAFCTATVAAEAYPENFPRR